MPRIGNELTMSTQPSTVTGESKRKYNRRSEAERIQALQEKLEAIKHKLEEKNKKHELSPVVKQIPRLLKKLKQYSAFAQANGRADIATSVMAFCAGLERIYHSDVAQSADEEDEIEIDKDFDSFKG